MFHLPEIYFYPRMWYNIEIQLYILFTVDISTIYFTMAIFKCLSQNQKI